MTKIECTIRGLEIMRDALEREYNYYVNKKRQRRSERAMALAKCRAEIDILSDAIARIKDTPEAIEVGLKPLAAGELHKLIAKS